MDIVAAIQQRRSVRAFKPDAVPQKTIKEIMEVALRAPSWANTQPWEFVIARGEKLEEIRGAYIEKATAGEPMNPDVTPPQGFPEPFDTRRRSLGRQLFEIMGIEREDREKRRWWQLQGLRLFEAPVVIYICVDRSFYAQDEALNVWPIFDCGLIAENIMLLAAARGLGTLAAIQAVSYPDVLRKVLDIPESKVIVLGIALGHPEPEDSANQLHSDRDPLDKVARWVGFD